jgi:hypothetical protein
LALSLGPDAFAKPAKSVDANMAAAMARATAWRFIRASVGHIGY